MDKIWVVEGIYGSKYKIYKTEAEMSKNTRDDSSSTIFEYELKSSVTASDYFTTKERDTQLRTILGELSSHEVNAKNLIDMYDNLVKDEWYTISRTRYNKKSNLNRLKKLMGDKKSFSHYLVSNKNHFFQLFDTVEWLLAILKCHNFQDHVYDIKKWDPNSKTRRIIDTSSDTLKENFKLAKIELKKKV